MLRAFCLWLALLAALPAGVSAQTLTSDAIARLAVLEGGRHKPLDSYAWESIRSISGTSHPKDGEGRRWQAIDLVLDIASRPQHWRHEKLIRIDYHGLKERLGFHKGEKLFSFDAVTGSPALSELIEDARLKAGDKAAATKLSTETQALYGRLVVLDELLSGNGFRILPVRGDTKANWLSPMERGGEAGQAWNRLLAAWETGDAYNFDEALGTLSRLIREAAGPDYPTAGLLDTEVDYNRLQPFHKAWLLYLLLTLSGLVAAAATALSAPERLRKALSWLGSGLLLAALTVHSAGLVYITLITGRAPVSNLFESLVFIIWSMVALAAVYYFLSKRENYMVLITGVIGLLSMGYALDSTIDISINPLVPVLKSYWLNIHVTVICFSYGAFAICAGLGHAWLWKYRSEPGAVAQLGKIDKLAYGILGVGVITLAAGIILGAVWANESWGRYWGWDPKETWSLITLLFYIAVIHGRLNGWISKKTTAILYIAGLAVVLMTYFGVNYYLSGLHSYATGNPEPFPLKLLIYVAAEIAFVAFCLMGGRQKQRLRTA
jgi:cytochrome c-type biogenesis protein CcsB